MIITDELGFFGNIWVRQNFMPLAGDTSGGHAHYHDHVTLLTHGSVEVTIEGHEPKVFHAPTFIVIRKEHRHQFRALEDGTNWYCVFALRDVNGDVSDIYDDKHDPIAAWKAPDDYWDNQQIVRTRATASLQGDHLDDRNHQESTDSYQTTVL